MNTIAIFFSIMMSVIACKDSTTQNKQSSGANKTADQSALVTMSGALEFKDLCSLPSVPVLVTDTGDVLVRPDSGEKAGTFVPSPGTPLTLKGRLDKNSLCKPLLLLSGSEVKKVFSNSSFQESGEQNQNGASTEFVSVSLTGTIRYKDHCNLPSALVLETSSGDILIRPASDESAGNFNVPPPGTRLTLRGQLDSKSMCIPLLLLDGAEASKVFSLDSAP